LAHPRRNLPKIARHERCFELVALKHVFTVLAGLTFLTLGACGNSERDGTESPEAGTAAGPDAAAPESCPDAGYPRQGESCSGSVVCPSWDPVINAPGVSDAQLSCECVEERWLCTWLECPVFYLNSQPCPLSITLPEGCTCTSYPSATQNVGSCGCRNL